MIRRRMIRIPTRYPPAAAFGHVVGLAWLDSASRRCGKIAAASRYLSSRKRGDPGAVLEVLVGYYGYEAHVAE
jgi:hypothetical protein